MKKIIILIFLIMTSLKGISSQENTYTADFNVFWETMRDNYGYFDSKKTNWDKVKEIYLAQTSDINSKQEFIKLLEYAIAELYDNHTHLLTNLPSSYRLAPSGLDIWAEWDNGKYIIKEVRQGSGAELCGLTSGMEISTINGIPVVDAVSGLVGKSIAEPDAEVKNWAIRTLFAGNYETKRSIGISINGTPKEFYPDEAQDVYSYYKYDSPIEFKTVGSNFGYIKINNSLGDDGTINAFDSAMTILENTNGMIIDLRETPGGGNSTVARAIMSRFISQELPYQKHEVPGEERVTGIKRSWIEYVSPRGKTYVNPLVVLVNHWTGSMGEGIAVGFSGLNRAKIVGTQMARLVGAKYDFRLPNTNIGVSYSAEKLYHINGLPREDFMPDVVVVPSNPSKDAILEKGIEILKETLRN